MDDLCTICGHSYCNQYEVIEDYDCPKCKKGEHTEQTINGRCSCCYFLDEDIHKMSAATKCKCAHDIVNHYRRLNCNRCYCPEFELARPIEPESHAPTEIPQPYSSHLDYGGSVYVSREAAIDILADLDKYVGYMGDGSLWPATRVLRDELQMIAISMPSRPANQIPW